eukprot:gnl/Spiro4/9906_TR5256_c0_g1_i1.p1 gnl/Spiro4/9906_TR5256_c0_g1~~gnl/Spiro4/9906_TR5256_c0_g1_i1.p1  ORF type:complete len:150 (-),score=0.57 gnl/Spiro4/9906_TR5256_c0_g1_i1:58-507(-)
MKEFFTQFGEVVTVWMGRSKRTGKIKGYGFIEFESPEVAQIVAETMNNYILEGRKLVCEVAKLDKLKPTTMRLPRGHINTLKESRKNHMAEVQKPKSPAAVERATKKLVEKEKAREAKLKQLGIDYKFHGYQAQQPGKPKRVKLSNDDE